MRGCPVNLAFVVMVLGFLITHLLTRRIIRPLR